MLTIVEDAWNWTGLSPTEIVDQNAFGNLIVRAMDGQFWRICPEELSCEVIAKDVAEYERLRENEEFRRDWEMSVLVAKAVETLGPIPPERCCCLKLPGVLGGGYAADNLGAIDRAELISFAGDFAEDIKDLPDAARIKLTVAWS
jgi:hypothetical protein